ncbi:MAG: Stp1/IreP family PP2C-type Ser/Thr phosphatase [Acidimicrobiia bacterium]
MKLISGGATDQGQVREANEDGYVVDRRLQLFAVADGMGGHRAGEVASATALEALRAAVASGTGIGDAITSANAAVHGKASDDVELHGMGTTLTAIVPDGNGVLIGHVGDSRAYLLRDGELRQLTTDHSLVEELVREGRLTEEQAAVHPQRSIITRALGVEGNVEVDVYPVALQPGDRLMLCSDGLTTMVRPNDIAAVLRQESDPTRAANLLVDAANAAGGEDNITTIVIDIEDDGADAFAAAPAIAGAATVEDAITSEESYVPPAPVDPAPEPDAPAVVTSTPTPSSAMNPAMTTSVGLPEGATAAQALAERERAERRKNRHPARSVGRFARFALPIILILGLAVAVTAWYARRTYYVAFDGKGRVTVYQGRPGGLLLWDPTVVSHTTITKAELPDATLESVQAKKEFSDKDGALNFVDTVKRRAREFSDSTSTSTSTSSTTVTTAPVGSVPST